ncbi:carbohydrate kinase family protein [Metabacillus sp. SLBN-84]
MKDVERSVICIGEALIDFYCTEPDVHLAEGRKFEKQAGGAPANVCAAIAKLGGRASFCGKAGNDPFGQFLKKTLDDAGADTSMLVFDPDYKTTLAFVSLQKNGERDFLFNRGADGFLTERDIDEEKWNQASILHFGSATALLEEPLRSMYLDTMGKAKGMGKFISFDPNYRQDLWKGRESLFISLAQEALKLADFIKMSGEELALISGEESIQAGLDALHKSCSGLIAVTLGSAGTVVSNRKERAAVSSIKVKSIDSTGAGDAFVGAFLYQLAEGENPREAASDMAAVEKMTAFSNVAGAAVCTKIGAIAAMPSLETVKRLSADNGID